MSLTLLDMVQDILSDMGSDEVNDVNDTVESLQVVGIIKNTYEELIAQRDWPWLRTLGSLEGLADVTQPTKMKIPSTVSRVEWIKYDKKKATDTNLLVSDVKYLEPKEFLDFVLRRNDNNTDTDKITDASGVYLLIKNNVAPTYWTSFDDEYIIFDSYDSGVDVTLQESKSIFYGVKQPTWTTTNTFVPDLPDHLFAYLLAESKSSCFIKLKQVSDPKEEQKARRQATRMQYGAWKQNGKSSGPNFGRK